MPDPTTRHYAREAKTVWDQRASRDIQAEPLPDRSHAVAIRLRGPCPACTHSTEFIYALSAWVEGISANDFQTAVDRATENGEGRSSWSGDVRMHCLCGLAHKGQDENEKGCGARFGMHVGWDAT